MSEQYPPLETSGNWADPMTEYEQTAIQYEAEVRELRAEVTRLGADLAERDQRIGIALDGHQLLYSDDQTDWCVCGNLYPCGTVRALSPGRAATGQETARILAGQLERFRDPSRPSIEQAINELHRISWDEPGPAATDQEASNGNH